MISPHPGRLRECAGDGGEQAEAAGKITDMTSAEMSGRKEQGMNKTINGQESQMGNTLGGFGQAGCSAAKARTSADEIMDMVDQTMRRAEVLAARLHDKLSPVMGQSFPPCPDCIAEKTAREYPPLFAELRQRVFSINSSLDSMESAIERTEL